MCLHCSRTGGTRGVSFHSQKEMSCCKDIIISLKRRSIQKDASIVHSLVVTIWFMSRQIKIGEFLPRTSYSLLANQWVTRKGVTKMISLFFCINVKLAMASLSVMIKSVCSVTVLNSCILNRIKCVFGMLRDSYWDKETQRANWDIWHEGRKEMGAWRCWRGKSTGYSIDASD